MILSLTNGSFRYADEPILKDVDFVVNEKEKWGVVGTNGSGKSTLIKLMAGELKPEVGETTSLSKYKISYCPQESNFDESKTIKETVFNEIKEKCEEYKVNSILTKLGFSDFDLKISILSGGQRKRVALAISLIKEADLYLLDEPTNHLDQEMIVWLEKYLIKTNKAIVMVTHDRYFLSRITDHMVEVDNAKLYSYVGNYADYLEQREIRYAQFRSIEAKRQNFLRNEIKWIRAGAQARTTKQKGRIERFEKIAAIEAPKQRQSLELSSASSRLGKKIIEFNHLTKTYDNNVLFKDFSYKVLRNDRIGIIGENGAGKSTLFKIIMGSVKPDVGNVEIGETVKIGYFAQHNEVFKENQRVIDYLKEFGEYVTNSEGEEISASKMLETFLFDKDSQYKIISKCSGGEKRRLYLCSILMQAPNVLLLDEPTNDLDTDTLTVLENYLDDFKGAVLVISHDRYFLDKVCGHLFIYENEKIRVDNSDYSTYLENKIESREIKEKSQVEVKREHAKSLNYKEKMELENINSRMPELEKEIEDINNRLNNESDYTIISSLSTSLDSLNKEYETLVERWMELSDE